MPKEEKELHKLFINKLKTLLDVETHMAEALPVMMSNATDEDLKAAFEEHLEETKIQAEKIQRILEDLEEESETLESEAIRGLTKDAEWVMDEVEKGPILDAALISAARSIEHYKISLYESAISWAELMEHSDAADTLQEILDEEEATNEKLEDLAASKIDKQANKSDESEDEEDDEEF